MLTIFKFSHSIESLRTIKTEDEAQNSTERKSAKRALIPIVEKLKFLDRRTDITEEELDKLNEKYKIFSNAVGFINNEMVDHDR